jgi:AraC-like DNA-binding protein
LAEGESRVPTALSTAPRVAVYLPAPALRSYVTFYYFVTSEGPVDDFLYPEWGNVRFVLSGDWRLRMDGYGPEPQIEVLFGPTDRCGRVTTQGGRIAGFGLTPLGWLRLIGSDASEMANRVRPLGGELGSPAGDLRDALASDRSDHEGVERFDMMLTEAIGRRPAEPPLMVKLHEVLRDRPTDVPTFAEQVGVSSRTLHRLCLRLFGYAPKRLLRRQRFLDTLGHVRSAVGEHLDEALDPDYFDQAHFYRDFRDFMGMSARAYFSASRALMSRAAEAQTAAGVTLSFKLESATSP